MARVFMTGLEGQDLNVFTTYGASAQIVTDQKRTGAAALYYRSNAYYARKTLPAALSEVYFRFGLRWHYAAALGARYIIRMYDADAAVQCNLVLDANGILQAYRTSSNIASGETAVSQDEWHCIEVRVKPAENPDGIFQVYLDGVLDIDFAGDTRGTTSSTIRAIQFGSDSASTYVANLWFDDIVVNDTSGDVNNSWPGRGGIHAIFPSGAGASTDLTPSAGDNYAAVDDAPPDGDTSYVEGATSGDHDSYAAGNLTPTAGAISAVCWWAFAKLTEAGAGSIERVYRIGGSDYKGTDQVLDTSYKYFNEIDETSPDSEDPWTIDEINAMEIGVGIV